MVDGGSVYTDGDYLASDGERANGRRSVLLGLVKTQWERVPSETLSRLTLIAWSSYLDVVMDVVEALGCYSSWFLL
ncbi:unnamed protein product [Cochlearia groenlandica]